MDVHVVLLREKLAVVSSTSNGDELSPCHSAITMQITPLLLAVAVKAVSVPVVLRVQWEAELFKLIGLLTGEPATCVKALAALSATPVTEKSWELYQIWALNLFPTVGVTSVLPL